jgi:DNA-directed RNA polymerase alpha subunit
MSVRLANVLKNENIKTIREARYLTTEHLKRIPNYGKKSMLELKRLLGKTTASASS